MNSRNIVRKSYSLTVNQLFHFLFGLMLFAAGSGMFAPGEARGDTFTVTNADDNQGIGSFRRAILDANNNPGADTIVFNIPGTGVQTIVLVESLPTISQPVVIDGWSQGGAGHVGPPLIELNVNSVPARLAIEANNTTIRGLIINGLDGRGITIVGDNNTIQGCYIGTTSDGQIVPLNQNTVIVISGDNNLIGGTTPGARNVISGNQTFGIILGRAPSDFGCQTFANNTRIEGNYIGISASGTLDLGNGEDGILVQCGTENIIGGTTPGARNVISGNGQSGVKLGFSTKVLGNYIGVGPDGFTNQGNSDYGIVILGPDNQIGGLPFGEITRGNVISGNAGGGIKVASSGNIIQGNLIGVGANGSTSVGNNGRGIFIEQGNHNQIGGSGAILEPLGAGNIIRNNLSQGVRLGLGAGTGNRISQNSIHANGNPTSILGIDLVSGTDEGPLFNDPCDLDEGVNNLQNFPVIASAISSDGNTTITGLLDSNADRTYTVEFFHSTTRDPSGFGEGRTYLGTRSIAINSPGCTASFNATFTEPLTPGHFITATATDEAGNTSAFSQSRAVAAR